MHTDPVESRRTQAGALVVHGMNAVLWALDSLCRDGSMEGPIASLTVSFQKFIYVGAEVTLSIARVSESSLRAELVSDGVTTTTIDVTYGAAAAQRLVPLGSEVIDSSQPLEMHMSNVAGRSGRLASRPDDRVAQAFPHAVKLLGKERLAEIAQLSKLVGVICPGLYSMFSGFSIRMIDNSASQAGLSFEVRNVDERFRLIELAVCGERIAGEVTAFLRRPPVSQRGVEELRTVVKPDEFSGVTALIVGGSRGLGALTANIIAAGGGRVAVTYFSGESDARAVAGAIGSKSATVLHYDARESALRQLTPLTWEIGQLYYFATAHIARQKVYGYSPERFAELCAVYVNGFADIWSALKIRSKQSLRAFYPSTIYVEEGPRDLIEYAMAKAAGEAFCAGVNRFSGDVRILVKRLPRLLTDQTATVMPDESADPLDAMLAVVREMQA